PSFPVHVAGDAAYARDVQVAVIRVQQRSVPRGVDRLGEVELVAKTVVNRQLRACPPGILRVEEVAFLEFLRIGCGTDVAQEVGHLAQSEGRKAQSTYRDRGGEVGVGRIGRVVVAEIKDAGAVIVARDT